MRMSLPDDVSEPRYLGDGVYAGFDGSQIWLWTERETGRHEIALQPPVMVALTDYADRVWGDEEGIPAALAQLDRDG